MSNYIYYDGFEDYNTMGQAAYYWNTVFGTVGFGSSSARTGNNGININNQGINYLKYNFSNLSGVSMGFAYQINANTFGSIASFVDGSTEQMRLILDSTNRLTVQNGQGATLGSGNIIANSTWYYIEWQCNAGSGNGSVYVNLNGVNNITVTGAITRQSVNNRYNAGVLGSFAYTPNTLHSLYDDFYLRSDGIMPGNVQIYSIFPTGNGFLDQFTPSSGTNYQDVKDNPPDSDSTYVSTSGIGNIDYYIYNSLNSGVIGSIMSTFVARMDVLPSGALQHLYYLGGTAYSGGISDIASTGYAGYIDIQDFNLSNSQLWVWPDISGGQFGVIRNG